ncbi:ATP-binding protein [Segetibacter sp.]|jgi:two-component system NtrC family sensor kinase|uniref:sensor histidine kinase n=1 Tax=Segetibacter sp. TaxID=2231182 RepID=UPI00260C505F|nr:ATP-binding protein [Segetibacter sp.]MCW3082453.1 histidine kinase [Segetibacter sp.]
MPGELILAFFLVRYFRKSVPETSPLKKWDKLLLQAMYVIAVLALLDLVVFKNNVIDWIAHFILLGSIGIAYLHPDFRFFRNTIIAVLPFAIVSFLTDVIGLIDTPFFRRIDNYLDIILFCTIAWMIAMFIIVNKQRKALEKERQKREIEEEQHRFIAARRAELETMVAARTSQLLEQKEELEHALHELRETQVQLIQKEKMASLGELTAGIAHEIQNPLNFVNNFSEVNKELLEEMDHEIAKGNLDEVKEIIKDIKENEIKISQHGKRADAIVKGMLQHSRLSSGKKEPTDINALADEYLRLSYHGLRAKDKSFNATFKTDFDGSIKEIEVIGQDIGRVLLNLINNAFYSVNEKKKAKDQLQEGEKYEPTVYVATKKMERKIQICVRDNGNGISQKVLDKIYQPFFTTKPAGQGTGLGLSLSYEILKAHGGELRVETREGEFAEFIMELPFT